MKYWRKCLRLELFEVGRASVLRLRRASSKSRLVARLRSFEPAGVINPFDQLLDSLLVEPRAFRFRGEELHPAFLIQSVGPAVDPTKAEASSTASS